jgi:hypothetical protein
MVSQNENLVPVHNNLQQEKTQFRFEHVSEEGRKPVGKKESRPVI